MKGIAVSLNQSVPSDQPVVEFGELPPDGRGQVGKHDNYAIAAELRANPGKWAKVRDGYGADAARIRNGSILAFRPQGAFEATTRNLGAKQRGDIWARYVGENGEYA